MRRFPAEYDLRSTKHAVFTLFYNERTYNDKVYTSPHLFGQFFNFRIFIKFFIHEVKKTSGGGGGGDDASRTKNCMS